ncbi:hypothetical protein ACLOJK_037507 [Asimina triloba]
MSSLVILDGKDADCRPSIAFVLLDLEKKIDFERHGCFSWVRRQQRLAGRTLLIIDRRRMVRNQVWRQCYRSLLLLLTAVRGLKRGRRGRWSLALPNLNVDGGDELRSRQIWNPGFTANLLDGSDRAYGALTVGSLAVMVRKMVLGLSVMATLVDEDDGWIGIAPLSPSF